MGAPAYRLPAEFEPHTATVMAWPCRTEIWGSQLRQAKRDYAEIARAIARFEPVTMVTRPELADDALELCGSTVEVISWPIDDSWARDIAAISVQSTDPQNGRLRAVDFEFNGWGNKFTPYEEDARFAARWAERSGAEHRRVPMVLEGGSISSDGQGTLLTTQQCLLHPNRNPGFTVAEIEAVLRSELGAETLLWLPFGLALDDDTDGHVDNVAAFVEPGLVVIQGCSDSNEADRDRMMINKRWLQGQCDARGRTIDTLELPVLPFTEVGGQRVVVPYLNLYICNGAVLVPVCGNPADDDMCELIGSVLPGREVVQVPGATLAYGGGGPHCITMQIPIGGAVAGVRQGGL